MTSPASSNRSSTKFGQTVTVRHFINHYLVWSWSHSLENKNLCILFLCFSISQLVSTSSFASYFTSLASYFAVSLASYFAAVFASYFFAHFTSFSPLFGILFRASFLSYFFSSFVSYFSAPFASCFAASFGLSCTIYIRLRLRKEIVLKGMKSLLKAISYYTTTCLIIEFF